MRATGSKRLLTLTLLYMVTSLIHFTHNAEFLADYPNLPAAWTRSGVYLAWLAMTCLGAVGLVLLRHGYKKSGLLLLGVYAVLGMDSIGHYVVAPLSAHTTMMNVTILLEVSAAAFVLIEVFRQVLYLVRYQRSLL